MKKIIVVAAALCLSLALVSCAPAASTGTSTNGSSQTSDQQSQQTTPQTGTQGSAQGTATSGTSTEIISEAQAKEIAFADAGIDESAIAAMYVNFKIDDGMQVYEVEFIAGGTEYDYEISAIDGTIREKDLDAEYSFGSSGQPGSVTGGVATISQDQAAQTALSRVSGATTSNLVIYYEYDDGRPLYEGKIIYGDREYDFEIDAVTGNIIEWEEESVWG